MIALRLIWRPAIRSLIADGETTTRFTQRRLQGSATFKSGRLLGCWLTRIEVSSISLRMATILGKLSLGLNSKRVPSFRLSRLKSGAKYQFSTLRFTQPIGSHCLQRKSPCSKKKRERSNWRNRVRLKKNSSSRITFQASTIQSSRLAVSLTK